MLLKYNTWVFVVRYFPSQNCQAFTYIHTVGKTDSASQAILCQFLSALPVCIVPLPPTHVCLLRWRQKRVCVHYSLLHSYVLGFWACSCSIEGIAKAAVCSKPGQCCCVLIHTFACSVSTKPPAKGFAQCSQIPVLDLCGLDDHRVPLTNQVTKQQKETLFQGVCLRCLAFIGVQW